MTAPDRSSGGRGAAAAPEVVCLPQDESLAAELQPLARAAAERLDLGRHLCRIELLLDDLEPDRRVWLSLRRVAGAGVPRRTLDLYLNPLEVLRDRPDADDLLGARPVWQPLPQVPEGRVHTAADFHRAKAERFLLHQFLFVRDLCERRLRPELVPRGRAEAFQEAWSITVDGRLRAWRLAAASQAERRASFSRLFSRYDVLLPEHWRVFHALWDMEDPVHDRVARLVDRLPRALR
ncbi:MAG: hypothetical protein R6X25_14300 [Candidatus Krumholzibacteriia bacterium]